MKHTKRHSRMHISNTNNTNKEGIMNTTLKNILLVSVLFLSFSCNKQMNKEFTYTLLLDTTMSSNSKPFLKIV